VATGMEMMLKGLGIDPDQVKANIEAFMGSIKESIVKIDAAQERIEGTQARIEGKIDTVISLLPAKRTTQAILDDEGNPTGVLYTEEQFPDAMLADAGLPVEPREANP
jgi:uncharacterized protein YjbJ (UPF0337 family)